MYNPLEKEFKEILDAETKAEMIFLLKQCEVHIVSSPNLKNFLKATIFTDNKNLLQAFNETKIFESQAIDYNTRIELLNSLANSYRYAYGGDLKLSTSQLETLKMFKSSDNTTMSDEFRRIKSSLKVLEKERPELIDTLKPHYFPENFSSEIIQMAQINANADKSVVQAQVKKAADEFKDNISLMTMLERASHILTVKNTLDYDFNIYRDKQNEPRFTAEESAIKGFLNDYPDKSSVDFQFIKSATAAGTMLFHFIRSVHELQEFQKQNNNLTPDKLSYDKLEQLAKILNKVANSHREMRNHDEKLRELIAQQPRQEMINKFAPPAINQDTIPLSNVPPVPQQIATKPMLRMVDTVLQETLRKLENAV